MATALDQTVERGTTAVLTFTVTQGGAAFDLSAALDIRWLAKWKFDDDDSAAVLTKTLAGGHLAVSGAGHNILTLTLDASDTKVGAAAFGARSTAKNGTVPLVMALRAYLPGTPEVVQGLFHDPTTGIPLAPTLTLTRVAGMAVT